ncbi:MAG: hypothetical protein KGJ86_17925, partial [Chloroflexota bacterium]|nr:hypothetical protein [Chloroflexota bacterium]
MLAVVQAASALPLVEVEVIHMGSASTIEQHILSQAGIPSKRLEVSGLRGSNPLRFGWRGLKMLLAVASALEGIDRF